MLAKRILKHSMTGSRKMHHAFPSACLNAIEAEIKHSEELHSGEIRFVVEASLSLEALMKHKSSRVRAIELFSQLRIWDTEQNNGLLIYLLLADRSVEIVADRGIHAKVSSKDWEVICRIMESDFKRGNYQSGVVMGINSLTKILSKHFPAKADGARNELANKPLLIS